MNTSFKQIALGAALAAASLASQAAVVFSDNFDANTLATDTTPTGWTVTNGSVDVIGQPAFYDYAPGNGRYVDLDGSTSNAGELTKTLTLVAGTEYTASFSLAGSQVSGYDSGNTVDVSFGTSTGTYTLGTSDPFATYTLVFTAASSGAFDLTFANRGGDNVGALLDNVSVTSVPEPTGLALVLAGLGVVGFTAARRRG